MKTNTVFKGFLIFAAGLILGGCAAKTETTTPEPTQASETAVSETEEYARMWDACAPVADASGVYELCSGALEGADFSDYMALGDSLLLISYRYDNLPEGDSYEEQSPVYTFTLYSPWEDAVIATLDTDFMADACYRIVGDQLVLLDYAEGTIYCYDSSLSLSVSCVSAEFTEFYGLSLYPTGTPDCFWSYDSSENALVRLTIAGDTCTQESFPLDVYDLAICAATPDGSGLMLHSVDTDTLRSGLFLFDPLAMKTVCTVDGSSYFYGNLTNHAYLTQTDYLHAIWAYGDFDGNASYFRLSDSANAQLLGGDAILVFENLYEEDSHRIVSAAYRASGLAAGSFSYDCGSLDGEDALYCADPVYLADFDCCFYLLCGSKSGSRLLVWSLADAQNDADAPALISYATEELALAAAQMEEGTEAETESESSFGESVTRIDDPESYDWGELSEARQTADALAEAYGVSLYIGPEVPEKIDVYDVAQCLDAAELEDALDRLSAIFSCYPDNFFSQLVYDDLMGIRIYIASDITSDAEGMVSYATGFVSNINSYIVMVLNVSDLCNWNYTINHEISHLIDRRLEFLSCVNPGALFSEESWCSRNPEDFDYLYTYADYWDNDSYAAYPEYFLDEYGATFPTEDRAELFGAAMSNYLDSDTYFWCFSDGSILSDKFLYYCESIRDGFDTDGWPEELPWEAVLSE